MERHILLIDDDEDEFFILSHAVDSMPEIKISYANSAQNGIEVIKTGLPDVVLLDMNMPEVNGLQCLDRMKRMDSIKLVPVFLYSTGLSDSLQVQAHTLGVTGCLKKARCISTVRDQVKRVLHLSALYYAGIRQEINM